MVQSGMLKCIIYILYIYIYIYIYIYSSDLPDGHTSHTRSRSPSPIRDTEPSGGQSARGRGSRGTGRGYGRGGTSRGRGGHRGDTIGSRGCGQSRRRTSQRGATGDDRWTWTTSKTDSNAPTFTGDLPGPKGDAFGVQNPTQCFNLFLSDYYEELLQQSNLYADQRRAAAADTSQFIPISKEELIAFIGLNIAMGVISLPKLNDYWSTDIIRSHPWFRSVMPRNRFRQILCYIHVADNSQALRQDDPTYDKLWKVRPMMNFLLSKCNELYAPHPQISVDESMIGTKCRLSFIQYLPQKPVKWGLKVWMCSDSVTGYIHNFDVYCGANSCNPPHENGLAYGVVMSLIEPFLHKGYTVYMDNFYSSPQLYKDLFALNTKCSGTLRMNRKHFPDFLKPAVLPSLGSQGSTAFAYHDDITIVRWKDTKDVCAMSTAYSDTMTVVWRRVDNVVQDVPCPEIIKDYNMFMGGVDLFAIDQVMCYYSIGRKSMKWWRRVLWRLIDTAVTNGFVIYAANNATSLDRIKSRVEF